MEVYSCKECGVQLTGKEQMYIYSCGHLMCFRHVMGPYCDCGELMAAEVTRDARIIDCLAQLVDGGLSSLETMQRNIVVGELALRMEELCQGHPSVQPQYWTCVNGCLVPAGMRVCGNCRVTPSGLVPVQLRTVAQIIAVSEGEPGHIISAVHEKPDTETVNKDTLVPTLTLQTFTVSVKLPPSDPPLDQAPETVACMKCGNLYNNVRRKSCIRCKQPLERPGKTIPVDPPKPKTGWRCKICCKLNLVSEDRCNVCGDKNKTRYGRFA